MLYPEVLKAALTDPRLESCAGLELDDVRRVDRDVETQDHRDADGLHAVFQAPAVSARFKRLNRLQVPVRT